MTLRRKLGLGFVFLWFFGGSIGHWFGRAFFISIVPPYIPYPEAAVYVSGVFEMLGAIGLCIAATRRWAGLGLFVLTICVTPANLHMFLHPELFPDVPRAFLGLRLVIQAFLLALVWWSTQTTDETPDDAPVLAPARTRG